MSEAKMRVDAMAGFAAPPFHPILTDAGGGPTFTMLGTTMRLVGVHRVTSIHVRTRYFIFLTVATSCMSEMSSGAFPLVPPRSCPATFHTAFATWRPRPAVWYSLSLPAD